ncbi:MAG TPA: rhodanese-like domain-containing protein, partial [Pyrinomonadaceae bacterium]
TRRFLLTAALALAAAALFGACKAADTAGETSAATAASSNPSNSSKPAATGTTQVDADGARRVTAAELQKMLEDGRTVVYDTRAKAAYEQEHIKGALSMPSNEVSDRAGEFPRDKTLVFYCT